MGTVQTISTEKEFDSFVPTSAEMTPELVSQSMEWVNLAYVTQLYVAMPPRGIDFLAGKNLNDVFVKTTADGQLDDPLLRYFNSFNKGDTSGAVRADSENYGQLLLLSGQEIETMWEYFQSVAIDFGNRLDKTSRPVALLFYNQLLPYAYQLHGLASMYYVKPPNPLFNLKLTAGSICNPGDAECPPEAPNLIRYLQESLGDQYSLKLFPYDYDWVLNRLVRMDPSALETMYEIMLNDPPMDPKFACFPIERTYNKGKCPEQCAEAGRADSGPDFRKLEQWRFEASFDRSAVPGLMGAGGGTPAANISTTRDLGQFAFGCQDSGEGGGVAGGARMMPGGSCFGPPVDVAARATPSGAVTQEEQRIFRKSFKCMGKSLPVPEGNSSFCIKFASDPDGGKVKDKEPTNSGNEHGGKGKDPSGSGKQEAGSDAEADEQSGRAAAQKAVDEDLANLKMIYGRVNGDHNALGVTLAYAFNAAGVTATGSLYDTAWVQQKWLDGVNYVQGPGRVRVYSWGSSGLERDENGAWFLRLSEAEALDPVTRQERLIVFTAMMAFREGVREVPDAGRDASAGELVADVGGLARDALGGSGQGTGRMCGDENCSGCPSDALKKILKCDNEDKNPPLEKSDPCDCTTGGACAKCLEGDGSNGSDFLLQCDSLSGANLTNGFCLQSSCEAGSASTDSTGLAMSNSAMRAACHCPGTTAGSAPGRGVRPGPGPDCPPGGCGSGSSGGQKVPGITIVPGLDPHDPRSPR